MSRLILMLILLITLFFGIITGALILFALTTGKLEYLMPAFIMLLIATGGIYMLVYKV